MAISPKVKALLKEWDTVKQAMVPLNEQLAPLKAREMALRKELATNFSEVVEGSKNVMPLSNGYSLKLTHKVKREVDESAFSTLYNDLKKESIPMDLLFATIHTLNKSVYSKLPVDQQAKVDAVLIMKEESPALELVTPKESK